MTKYLLIASGIGLLSVGVGWMTTQAADFVRPDCPGKIECPLTGELVCRDQCPATDQERTGCPGKIECPINGELVCKDRCPVGSGAGQAMVVLPPCCR